MNAFTKPQSHPDEIKGHTVGILDPSESYRTACMPLCISHTMCYTPILNRHAHTHMHTSQMRHMKTHCSQNEIMSECINFDDSVDEYVRHVLQHFLPALLFPLWRCRLWAKLFVLCVCVCVEIFMRCSGNVLWGCSSGECQAASFSHSLTFSFSVLRLLCTNYFRRLIRVLQHCLSSFPLLCLLSPSLCFSVEASSSTPKAIHFSGLFENRLLHFILAVHKHHCATQTSKWFNTEQRRTVMLLIFICADSSVSLQSYNWLVLKLKNPITVLPAVYSFIIVCDSCINPHLVQTLKVRCH